MLELSDENSKFVPADGDKESVANHIVEFLTSKADMLHDYFSIAIKVSSIKIKFLGYLNLYQVI